TFSSSEEEVIESNENMNVTEGPKTMDPAKFDEGLNFAKQKLSSPVTRSKAAQKLTDLQTENLTEEQLDHLLGVIKQYNTKWPMTQITL
ncbi:MAG: hypothetical protein K940chlam6_00944, partial [Chlamydiae bacterium]|nr:hypothetical protein [Chlamydiota bacterium]